MTPRPARPTSFLRRGIVIASLVLAVSSTQLLAQISESIADNTVRFFADDDARDNAAPSLSMVRPFPALGAAPAEFPVTVQFSEQGGRHVAEIDVPEGTSLYGTGSVPGQLLRNGRTVETWNTDAFGYSDDTKSLYTSHPWVLAVRPDGTSFGVLADTTWRCEIDLTSRITFRAEGQAFPVIIIERDTPQEVVQALGMLTGTIEMPPIWAIGYHQCRYSYYPDSRALEVAQEFRNRQIPLDVLWHDIDYMEGYRCFTFDDEGYPDPARHNADLHALNVRTVWMIDPGLKNEEGYFVHDQGDAIDAWVKRADGTEFVGDVWPGACVFPDYMRADVRDWWANLYPDFMATGIDGVWNDMNEPAVFNVESKTMPETNLHDADPELGGPGDHARYHNVYGMFMIKATHEGAKLANPDKRPFVLSRANFIGGHRYGATWTGDNVSTWYHLDVSVPMSINLGLSAQPFSGPDIGGFAGNGDAEMFRRWMGFGAMFPFSRGHTAKGNIDKEPWSFGEEVEHTARRALERRYRLLSHFYTAFYDAHKTGMPIMQPTFFADPTDPALRSEDDSFLIGPNLLIECDLNPQRDRVVVMPKPVAGVPWRSFDFPSFDGGRDSKDLDLPTMYVKPGTLVTAGPIMQYATEKALDPLVLIVNLDADGTATGRLYEDAGEGYGYTQGVYLLTTYEVVRAGNTVTIRIAEEEGNRPRPERNMRIRLLTDDGEVEGLGRDGATWTFRVN